MRRVLIVLAALVPAACAHHRDEIRESDLREPVVEVERVPAQNARDPRAPQTAEPAPAPLRRPDAEYARLARYGKRTMASDAAVQVTEERGHLRYPDLFRFVSEETGVRIRFEEQNPTIKSKTVSTLGPGKVAKDDLIAWFQDACAVDMLVAVQLGPPDRREMLVMDMANPNLQSHAESVDEDDLPALAGRSGLYVSCVLTVPEGLEPQRVRNALASSSTRIAGLGRVMEIDGGSGQLLVTDFASVVSNMRQLLDRIAVDRWEAAQRD